MNVKGEILVRLVRTINGKEVEVYNFIYSDTFEDLERANKKFKELVVDQAENSTVFNSYTGTVAFYSDIITKVNNVNNLNYNKK